MRVLGAMLTFAFILAGPLQSSHQVSDLPGIGTFSYSGPPIVNVQQTAFVMPRASDSMVR